MYHKSQVLYGLDLAKRDIARGKQVVVVEGYTDVMACHLAGVTTAVATCGTSFGVDHIKIVRRIIGDTDNPDTTGTGEVIFTFDPDEAGQKAASRAFAEEQRFAAQTFVAVAPEGLDPCDLRLNRGDDAVRRLIKTRKPMFEFMVRRVLTGFDLETVEGRVSALRAAAPVVAGIRDQSMSVGYVRNLAGWLGLDPAEVQRAVTAARSAQSARSAPGDDGREDQGRGSQGHGAQVHSGQQRGSRDDARQAEPILILDEPSITRLATDTTTRTERDVLMAILQHPQLVGPALMSKAATVGFGDGSLEIVRDAVAVSLAHADSSDWIARVTAEVPQRYATLVNQLAVAPIPAREDTLPVYCVSIVSDFIDRDLLREKRQVMGSMQRLDATTEPERYAEVQRELVRIETERRVLRNE